VPVQVGDALSNGIADTGNVFELIAFNSLGEGHHQRAQTVRCPEIRLGLVWISAFQKSATADFTQELRHLLRSKVPVGGLG